MCTGPGWVVVEDLLLRGMGGPILRGQAVGGLFSPDLGPKWEKDGEVAKSPLQQEGPL